jgi:HlyD family secretion protein
MVGVLRNRRVLFSVLVVAALLAAALWPRTEAVETAVVTSGPMVVTIDEDGRTRVRDRFVVTAPVSGEVLRIDLRPGDRVEKGKTRLATIRAAAPMPLDARTRAEVEAAIGAAESAVGARLSRAGEAQFCPGPGAPGTQTDSGSCGWRRGLARRSRPA